MGRYRKKPVEVDAWPVRHLLELFHDGRDLPTAVRMAIDEGTLGIHGTVLVVKTVEGTMTAGLDSWLIRDVELYPCDRYIFAQTYEPVPEGQ